MHPAQTCLLEQVLKGGTLLASVDGRVLGLEARLDETSIGYVTVWLEMELVGFDQGCKSLLAGLEWRWGRRKSVWLDRLKDAVVDGRRGKVLDEDFLRAALLIASEPARRRGRSLDEGCTHAHTLASHSPNGRTCRSHVHQVVIELLDARLDFVEAFDDIQQPLLHTVRLGALLVVCSTGLDNVEEKIRVKNALRGYSIAVGHVVVAMARCVVWRMVRGSLLIVLLIRGGMGSILSVKVLMLVVVVRRSRSSPIVV